MKLTQLKYVMALATVACFSNSLSASSFEVDTSYHLKHFEDERALYAIPAQRTLETHELSFLSTNSPVFDKDLLSNVQRSLGKGAGSSFSNIATACIVFHCWAPGVGGFKFEFKSPSKYVSGGGTIDDESFKKSHGLVCANPDFISAELSKNIEDWKEEGKFDAASISLGKSMENSLRDHVAGGAWRANGVHSEALILLDVRNKLPCFLSKLCEKATELGTQRHGPAFKFEKLVVNRVTIGINTYYKTCYKCRELTVSFQRELERHIITAGRSLENQRRIGKGVIQVNSFFGTLVMSHGQVMPENNGDGVPHKLTGPKIKIFDGSHRFVHINFPKRMSVSAPLPLIFKSTLIEEAEGSSSSSIALDDTSLKGLPISYAMAASMPSVVEEVKTEEVAEFISIENENCNSSRVILEETDLRSAPFSYADILKTKQ